MTSIDAKLHSLKVDKKEVTLTLKVSAGNKAAALELAASVGRELRCEFTDPQGRLGLGED